MNLPFPIRPHWQSFLRSPATFLAVIGVIGALLGLVRVVFVTRELGAAQLGVIAIVAAIPRGVITFLDVRLSDVASKLYYRDDRPADAHQATYLASVIQLCLLSYLGISCVAVLLSFALSYASIHVFTQTPVAPSWMLAQGIALALVNLSSAATFLQRFSESFTVMGVAQLLGQVLALAVFVACLSIWPTLQGYYTGTLVGCLTTAGISVGVLGYLCRRHSNLSLLSRGWRSAWPDYRRELRFLFFTNLLGYTKMLHRGTDVLLVGYFANDRTTGVYRLARTAADGFFILFDALNQVYLPRFFGYLRNRGFAEYRRLASRLLVGAALLTVTAVSLELTALRWGVARLLPEAFQGIDRTIAVLTIPVVFAIGVHLWVWPLLVHRGRIGHFTAANVASVLVHYLVTTWALWNGGSATAASLGYLSRYLVVYPVAFLLAYRTCPEVVPLPHRWRTGQDAEERTVSTPTHHSAELSTESDGPPAEDPVWQPHKGLPQRRSA